MLFLIHTLDLIGTGVFAITGALAAGKKRMDIFGVVVLGCVTALGGGTLRDVILGSYPIFWISDELYLAVAVLAALGTLMMAKIWRMHEKLLIYADAVGLAVFTVIGFQKGFHVTHSYSIAIVMGVTTGVVGGIIRDILSGEIPLILRQEIYASASLCGAVLFAVMSLFSLANSLTVPVSILTVLAIRLAAIHWNLSLPLFYLKENNK